MSRKLFNPHLHNNIGLSAIVPVRMGGTSAGTDIEATIQLGTLHTSLKAAPDGIASLNSASIIPINQFPDYLATHQTDIDPHDQYVLNSELTDTFSPKLHTHTASQLTNLIETVQDIAGMSLTAGNNLIIIYDDETGIVTVRGKVMTGIDSVNGLQDAVVVDAASMSAEPAGTMSTHIADLDPHSQYISDSTAILTLAPISHTHTDVEIGAEPAGSLSSHIALADPHPQYMVESEADSRYPLKTHTHTSTKFTDLADAIIARMLEVLQTSEHISYSQIDDQIVITATPIIAGVNSINGEVGDVTISATDVGAEPAGAVAAHAAETDPHHQYYTESDADARHPLISHTHTTSEITDIDDKIKSTILSNVSSDTGITLDGSGEQVIIQSPPIIAGVNSINGEVGVVITSATDVDAEPAGAVAAHAAELDPHLQYMTETETDIRYSKPAQIITQTYDTLPTIVAGPNISLTHDALADTLTVSGVVTSAGVDSVNGRDLDVVLSLVDLNAEPVGTLNTHLADNNPHPQYLSSTDHAGSTDHDLLYLNATEADSIYTQTSDAVDVIDDLILSTLQAGKNIIITKDAINHIVTIQATILEDTVDRLHGYQGDVVLTASDVGAEPANTLNTHISDLDPHPQYLVESEADAKYLKITDLSAAVKNTISTSVINGTNITLAYDSETGLMTITCPDFDNPVTSVHGMTGDVVLTSADIGAEPNTAISNHIAELDPHPQYITESEGDVRYVSPTELQNTTHTTLGTHLQAGNNIFKTLDAGKYVISANVVSGGVDSIHGQVVDVVLTAVDINAEPVGSLSSHIALADPHPQYMTETEGDVKYIQLSNIQAPLSTRISNTIQASDNTVLDTVDGKPRLSATVMTGAVVSVNGMEGILNLTPANMGLAPVNDALNTNTTHEANLDPHIQYIDITKGDIRYVRDTGLNNTIRNYVLTALTAGKGITIAAGTEPDTIEISLGINGVYVSSFNTRSNAVVLSPSDIGAEVAGAYTAHASAPDPHMVYLNDARADARYMTPTGLDEIVQDRMGEMFTSGVNTSVIYDDTAGKLIIASASGRDDGFYESETYFGLPANALFTMSAYEQQHKYDLNAKAYRDYSLGRAKATVLDDMSTEAKYTPSWMIRLLTSKSEIYTSKSITTIYNNGYYESIEAIKDITFLKSLTVVSAESYHENIIPVLTSATSHSPIVTSASSTFSASFQAWEAFAATNDLYTAWMSINGQPPTPANPQWLAIDLGYIIKVDRYVIRNDYNANGSSTTSPKDWIFQGSLDGTTWVDLDVVSNDVSPSYNTLRYFQLPRSVYYRHYRLYITGRNGGNPYVAVGKFYLEAKSEIANLANDYGTGPYIAYGTQPSTINRPYTAFRNGYNAFAVSNPLVSGPQWIAIDLGTIKKVTGYMFKNSTSGYTCKSWLFQGSMDGGLWIDLDTVVDNINTTPQIPRGFLLTEPAYYKHYRLYITDVNRTSGSLHIGNFILYIDIQHTSIYKNIENNTYYTIDNNQLKSIISPPTTVTVDKSLIPTMTDNITPSPYVASASSIMTSNTHPWKAFSYIYGNHWASLSAPTPANPQWLAIDIGVGTLVNRYSIINSNLSGIYSPKDWIFQGSLDGTTWVDIHSVVGDTYNVAYGPKTFILTEPVSYRHYRIYVTASNGNTYVSIGRFYLYGPSVEVISPTYIEEHGFSSGRNYYAHDQITRSIVPHMTSNRTPSPYVVTSNDEFSSTYAGYNGFTLKNNTYWRSSNAPTPANPIWLSINLGDVIKIDKYSIRTTGDILYSPKDWIFQGSLDGTTWVDIHSVVGDTNNNAYQIRSYELSQSVSYQHYRIYITASNGNGAIVAISYFQLYLAADVILPDITTITPLTMISNHSNTFTALVQPDTQILIPATLIDASTWESILSITFTYTEPVDEKIRIAVTRDGSEYFTWTGTNWLSIGALSPNSISGNHVINNCIDIPTLQSLTKEQWALLYTTAPNGLPDKLGFAMAFQMLPTATSTNLTVDNISASIDYTPIWQETDANQCTIKYYPEAITFFTNTSGNYKFSYQTTPSS